MKGIPYLVAAALCLLLTAEGAAAAQRKSLQVEIEVAYVQFPLAAIAPLSARGTVTLEALRELRKRGKGVLLCAPCVRGPSGQNASVRSSRLYEEPIADGDAAPAKRYRSDVALNETPTVGPDGVTIDVVVQPELSIREIPNENADATAPEREVFKYSTATTLKAQDGVPMLLGGGVKSPDGTGLVYVIVTARLVHADGSAAR